MNKIVFILSLITTGSLGYWVGKNDNISAAPTAIVVLSEHEGVKTLIPATSSQAIVEQHAGVVLPIEVQLTPPAEPSIVDNSAQHQIDAIKQEYELKQRSESFTNWLIKNQETKPWFDLGIEMRGRFDAEETDHNWASIEEGHIQSLFAQEQALAGIAVKSTTCKSTQCQITVSVMDNDHANETAMTITQVLGGEKFPQIIIDSQVQQGETIFYVARNEKGFEFN